MTAPVGPAGHYASAKPFFDRVKRDSSNLAGSPDDLQRLSAYGLYEDMYFNRPESFRVFIRGDNEDDVNEIYIPSAKKMVEAMNRFLAKDYSYVVSPTVGEESVQNELILRLGNFAKREKLGSKFSNQKRFGLIRGDACWLVTADETKPQYSRVSLHELNPGNYFPITDPGDKNRILGCHIVEIVRDVREKDDRTKTVAKRQTYLKAGVSFNQTNGQYEMAEGSTETGVFYETTHWEIGKWDDRNMKKDDLKQVKPYPADTAMTKLNDLITSLPVYHWKNGTLDTDWGLSEVAGIETLIAGVNQSATDEDLTLVLQGLGVYATDSKPPQDASGNTVPWTLGPGIVVETAQGTNFNRVSGVSSVAPFIEHMNMLKEGMQEGNGIPDIAAGKVDVAVAESGVSLALQLAPILASAREKEQEILAVMDHLLYDLVTMWFPAYEQSSFPETSVSSSVGDAMPVNREARIQEIMLLFTSGLVTIAMAQAELTKFGYNFQAGDDLAVLKEAAARAAASGGDKDAFNRYEQETKARERTLNPGAGELPETGLPAAGGAPGTAGGVAASIPQPGTL